MRITPQFKRDLRSRSIALPVPLTISMPIADLFCNWLEVNGSEWTIDRFKSIKLDLIRSQAGLPKVSVWVAKSKSGFFKGPFGALERFAFNERRLDFAVQLLQMFTLLIAPGVTPKQEEKFLSGVLCAPPSERDLEDAFDFVKCGFKKAQLRKVRFLKGAKPLMDRPYSPGRRAPTPSGSSTEVKGIIDSLDFLFNCHMGRRHYTKFKPFYDEVMEGLDWYKEYQNIKAGSNPCWNDSGTFVVGRIGLIQEPGYKLRAVANPGRVFQQVLEPIGDVLYGTLARACPWDCTFDQSKSFPVLQQALSEGKVVHSIDLSGATDYFPLSLQMEVLKGLFPSDACDLFNEIATATWLYQGAGIQWQRGQPLGLYPSFGLFALTHGLLLLGMLGKVVYDNQFFILGDDVVILDNELAASYNSLMAKIGCPISGSKSLVSTSICEFGGKIITKGRITPQYKWRSISDDSFIDIARNLGPRSLRLFKPRQLKILKYLSDIPESVGGFGWNPEGLPLGDRLQKAKWLFEDEEPQERTMSYTGRNLQILYESDNFTQACMWSSLDENLTMALTCDLDQRSIALTRSCISESLIPWYMILGKNIDQVFIDSSTICDLPVNMVRERSTSLSQWERKVNRYRR